MAQIGSPQRQLADLVHKSLASLAAPAFRRKDALGDLRRSHHCLGENMPTLYVETSIVSYLPLDAAILDVAEEILRAGLTRPIICTPEELLIDVAETD